MLKQNQSKMKKIAILAAGIMLIFSACTKENQPQPTVKQLSNGIWLSKSPVIQLSIGQNQYVNNITQANGNVTIDFTDHSVVYNIISVSGNTAIVTDATGSQITLIKQ